MQQVEKRSKDKEISTVRKRTLLPDKLKESQMKDRFWAVSPLDYRYYGADKEVFDRLNPYVSERAFIKYQLTVEAALAKQLAHKDWRVCTKEQANEIVQACKQVTTSEVMEEERSLHHVVRALVNCIQKRVSPSARPYVHLFATSNDITDTATTLRLKDLTINVLMPDLVELEQLLISLAREYADTPQIGRTHGKHAEPITFGFALATYVDRILGRIKRLVDSADNLRGKFSGSVGAYNALSLRYPQDPALFEKQLLESLGLKPSEGGISTQIVEPEYVTDLAYAVVSSFSVLANLADDIRNLHRTEIGEVQEFYEDEEVGSSTMPHKANPKNFEHVKSMWKATMPRIVTVFMDQISEHQRDLTNSASERFLIELFVAFDYSVTRLTSALRKLSVNVERMRTNLEMSKDWTVAEPLYILLALNGLPDAYSRTRELVRQSEKIGVPLTDLMRRDQKIRAILDRLDSAQLAVLKDPSKYVGASGQRARAVTDNAELNMSMVLSQRMKGSINDRSLGRFREQAKPFYHYMGLEPNEFATTSEARESDNPQSGAEVS